MTQLDDLQNTIDNVLVPRLCGALAQASAPLRRQILADAQESVRSGTSKADVTALLGTFVQAGAPTNPDEADTYRLYVVATYGAAFEWLASDG